MRTESEIIAQADEATQQYTDLLVKLIGELVNSARGEKAANPAGNKWASRLRAADQLVACLPRRGDREEWASRLDGIYASMAIGPRPTGSAV